MTSIRRITLTAALATLLLVLGAGGPGASTEPAAAAAPTAEALVGQRIMVAMQGTTPDAGLLTRVFQNLVANAIQHTREGEVVIGAAEDGQRGAVQCTVSDTGTGIPAEIADSVFEKGETHQESEGGLGLGLAIVKTFVEAHGGTVRAERNPTVGTTFRFSLPGPSETAS